MTKSRLILLLHLIGYAECHVGILDQSQSKLELEPHSVCAGRGRGRERTLRDIPRNGCKRNFSYYEYFRRVIEIALGMKMTNLCLVLVGVEQHQLKEVVDVH